MLKKLRIKFVAINTTIAALVLTIAFSVICFANYAQDVERIYQTLNNNITSAKIAKNTFQTSAPPHSFDAPIPPEIGGEKLSREELIPVALYIIDQEGAASLTPSQTSAQLSDSVFEEAKSIVLSSSNNQGFIPSLGLYYAKSITPQGTLLAFIDSASASGWKTLALILGIVGLGIVLCFFALSIALSRWALHPVEKAWNQQRQFVSDASHELKTPLTIILANTEILKSQPEKIIKEQNQWLESTEHEAKNMQSLVHDLLDLAHPEDSKTTPVLFEKVDMSDLIEKEVLQFESIAYERDITLESSIEKDLFTHGNQQQLQRLISILLDNAFKYTEPEQSVFVTAKHNARTINFSVRNTGSFIIKEDLEHVFDRFYRADKARTRTGHGLGLSIAHKIVHTHQGRIDVSSTLEEGTVFTVELPIAHFQQNSFL